MNRKKELKSRRRRLQRQRKLAGIKDIHIAEYEKHGYEKRPEMSQEDWAKLKGKLMKENGCP